MKIRFEIKLFLIISIIFLNKIKSQNKNAIEIIEKSIDAHGGKSNLDEIKKIKYSKKTFFYDHLGKIKNEIHQVITHEFNPYKTKIISGDEFQKTNGILTELTKNGKKIYDFESLKKTKSTLDGAFYVFWQPMKLKDPETIMNYLGEVTLPNQKDAHAIEISYLNGSDKWNFYFDTSSYLLVATEVNHNNKISLIYTTDFNYNKYGVFHYKRESYKVTENRSKLILQASYIYEVLDISKK